MKPPEPVDGEVSVDGEPIDHERVDEGEALQQHRLRHYLVKPLVLDATNNIMYYRMNTLATACFEQNT